VEVNGIGKHSCLLQFGKFYRHKKFYCKCHRILCWLKILPGCGGRVGIGGSRGPSARVSFAGLEVAEDFLLSVFSSFSLSSDPGLFSLARPRKGWGPGGWAICCQYNWTFFHCYLIDQYRETIWRGRLSTVDLLVLISLNELLWYNQLDCF